MRKGKGRSNGLLPNSLRIISSCLKTVSTNASTVASTVRSAGASVAASISVASDEAKDQVLWAGFDKLELDQSTLKHVLLLGYSNGFQVLDVEDAANVSELVSKRDGPVTFLQMQPIPEKSEGCEGFRASHPLLLVVAGDETNSSGPVHGGGYLNGVIRDGNIDPQPGNCVSPTAVRFYSLRSHSYVHMLRFRSAVYMVRCSPRIVAVGLANQIYCFDALTLEMKFSVLTYPVPQVGGQGAVGVSIGYGPMAVGPRWLAYASNNPLLSNTGRLSPQNLSPSPGVSPSTSPSSGSLVARYAVESSKHLAAGIINLGDMGYKTLSKYCQEFLPDGSNSPVSTNSGRKVGRLASSTHSNETDNAGMVVVKDFVSRAVISQFRAHTSPISALCFDPSGTLLVTASVHGNNINIFRIMPSCISTGSSTPSYDWSSSHVHLYKLYRGITSAVIQDICFSHYSQWITIVSSRGTCHVFVLSPFGGEVGLQTQNSSSDGPTLLPGLSIPWWSTSSCMVNQQLFSPPPSITLSVVSRIKNSNSGWLNTVSNAAASATGKIFIPSGAVAAIFHNSVYRGLQHLPSRANALEHLLVYTPSGHVVQHELLPSLGAEQSENSSRTGSGSNMQIQDDELRVKVEPLQWWDVCRRSDWPEREECISQVSFDRQEASETIMDSSDSEDNDVKYMMEQNTSIVGKELLKSHERPHWYLSNAEVQINSGRIPIWQKSKISFYMMIPLRTNERWPTKDCAGGEIEIEKVPVHEVEIRRKDLLPVFDHFHSIKSDWNDRGLVGGRYMNSSSDTPGTKGKFTEETVTCHSKPASLGSVGSSDGGSVRTESLLDLDQINTMKSSVSVNPTASETNHDTKGSLSNSSSFLSPDPSDQVDGTFPSEHCTKSDNLVGDSSVINGLSSSPSVGSPLTSGALTKTGVISEILNASSDCSTFGIKTSADGPGHVELQEPLDFGQYFDEGYCKVTELDECRDSTEVVTDADSNSSHCERDKPEEGDNDDMLGGVFAFSEEG
ncbi:PREDICTED: autophagy-related protein 18g-like [Nelumbo nucifera]|uniref:Autophagy-related protein 18g-like n=2 Tax=Nelumbo nucifera TaxID=4432 RepID=A0A1U8PY48_NELNU|nr:PREDICTED: autophagy-related protein 18g-like [Nelumbo nucifera]XP_019051470.1 PREDICTED: autophagy-related protein 18g-like [Nelumbo nucifera]DAD37865.1 TPA_asm: hypothetical protein HUJ06_008506 [Nelumbo nucifera]